MYRHTIIFRLGDGGKFIIADFGFDKDGNGIYKISESSDPLSLDVHEAFIEYMRLIEKLNKEFSGVPVIVAKQDSYIDPKFKLEKIK